MLDFYGCDLTNLGVVELSRISGGEEGEIAKVNLKLYYSVTCY